MPACVHADDRRDEGLYLQYVPRGAARLPERDRPCGLPDKKGLPFRAAYKIAGQLVAYCIEHTAVLEELPLALLRQYSERFGEDVYAAIALTSCVTGRTSLGGTCVASVEAQIASVRDFLAGQTEAAKQARNG